MFSQRAMYKDVYYSAAGWWRPMLELVKGWVEPPIFPDDDDKNQQAKILYMLQVSMFVFLLFATMGIIFIFVNKILSVAFLLILLGWLLISRILAIRGHISMASNLFVGGLWVAFSAAILLTGRFNTTWISLYLAIIVMAGVLLGRRSAMNFALLSSIVGLGLVWLEHAGYYLVSYFPAPSLTSWVIWLLALILTIAPLNPTIQSLARSTDELHKSRTQLNAIFTNSVDAIFAIKAGVFTMVNPSFLKMHGFEDANDVIGRSVLELVAPESQEAVADNLRRWAEGESVPSFYEILALRQDGTKFWVELSISIYELGGEIYILVIERDVTERIQAEEELRKLSRAIESAPVSFVITDIDGHIEYVNPFFTTITGYASNEIVGANPKILKSGLTPSNLYPQLWETILKGESWEGEFINKRKNGDLYTEQARISPIYNATGTVTHFVAIKQDITQRKIVEKALLASEARYRALFEQAHDAVFIMDIEGRYQMVNQRAVDLLGYTLGELLELSVEDTSAEINQTRSVIERLHAGEYIPLYERLFRKKNGETFPAEVNIELVRDENGDFLHYQSTIRDITQRKQAEAALRESEEKFFKAFRLGPVGMAITSISDGKFVDANQSFLDIFEFSRDEAIGRTSVELNIFTPEERQKLVQHQKEQGGVKNFEMTAQTKSGRNINLLFSTEFMEINGETCLLSILTDVTERKSAENALRRSEEQFRLIMDNLSDLVAVLDLEGHRIYNSPSYSKIFESLEKLQGTLSFDEIHPEDKALVRQSFLDTVQTGEGHLLEYRLLGDDGRSHYIESQGNVIHDEKGRIAQVVVVSRDVTERKQMEMQEHEQRILAEALSSSSAALNGTLDFRGVLSRILDNIGQVIPHDAANIMLLDMESKQVSLVSHRGYIERGANRIEIERQFALSTMPKLEMAFHTGQPLAIPNTDTEKGWVKISYTSWVKSYLTIPIRAQQDIVGFLNLDSGKPNFFNDSHVQRLQAFASYAAIAINNASLYEDMKRLAVTDSLTGIYNRVFFDAELARIESSRDYPVSIVVVDMDNLKTTNDNLGHAVGDELLMNATCVLQDVFRASDVVARIGGDEFAILLPKTNSDATSQMIQRIRAKLDDFNRAHSNLPLQFSIGASTTEHGELRKTLALADQRMYADKAKRKSFR